MTTRSLLAAIEREEFPADYASSVKALFNTRKSIANWGTRNPQYNSFPLIRSVYVRSGQGGSEKLGLVPDYQNGNTPNPYQLKLLIDKLRGNNDRAKALAHAAKEWALTKNDQTAKLAANFSSNLLDYVMATKDEKPKFEFTFRPPKDRQPDLVVTDYLKENAVPMGVGAAVALAIRAFLK